MLHYIWLSNSLRANVPVGTMQWTRMIEIEQSQLLRRLTILKQACQLSRQRSVTGIINRYILSMLKSGNSLRRNMPISGRCSVAVTQRSRRALLCRWARRQTVVDQSFRVYSSLLVDQCTAPPPTTPMVRPQVCYASQHGPWVPTKHSLRISYSCYRGHSPRERKRGIWGSGGRRCPSLKRPTTRSKASSDGTDPAAPIKPSARRIGRSYRRTCGTQSERRP